MTPRASSERGARPLVAAVLAAIGATLVALVLAAGGAPQAAAQSDQDQRTPGAPERGEDGGGREAVPPAADRLSSGRELYLTSCVNCHGAEGKGTADGPQLTRSGEAITDFYLRTGRMPLTVQSPQARAKPVAFNDEQIKALVAYVGSLCEPGAPCTPIPELHPDQASIERGADLYLANCSACHGSAAVGGALSSGRHAPSLQQTPPLQVAEAIRTGPGQMPVFGPEVLSDEQVNDVANYVHYLHEPESPGGVSLAYTGPVAEGFAALLLGLGSLVLACRWITREPKPADVGARPAPITRTEP